MSNKFKQIKDWFERLEAKLPEPWMKNDVDFEYQTSLQFDGSLLVTAFIMQDGEPTDEANIVIPYKFVPSFYKWLKELMGDR